MEVIKISQKKLLESQQMQLRLYGMCTRAVYVRFASDSYNTPTGLHCHHLRAKSKAHHKEVSQ